MRIPALDVGTSSVKAAVLSLGDKFERIFLTGGGAEIVQRLIPEYAGGNPCFPGRLAAWNREAVSDRFSI
jgi:hypothetical protein